MPMYPLSVYQVYSIEQYEDKVPLKIWSIFRIQKHAFLAKQFYKLNLKEIITKIKYIKYKETLSMPQFSKV